MTDLAKRLAELRKAQLKSAPSFLPRAKREPVVVPDVREFITDVNDLRTLRELAQLHVQYGTEERRAKALKKPIAEAIKGICSDYSLSKVAVDENKISYYKMGRETISAALLMDEGVSIETIKRCTVRTETYAVRVTPPGGRDDDDADD
jgi:hypothetical protein